MLVRLSSVGSSSLKGDLRLDLQNLQMSKEGKREAKMFQRMILKQEPRKTGGNRASSLPLPPYDPTHGTQRGLRVERAIFLLAYNPTHGTQRGLRVERAIFLLAYNPTHGTQKGLRVERGVFFAGLQPHPWHTEGV